ncbi:tetratricopeptide repeat protein [Paenarthrobacter sp. AB444]|uniref:tetratricopeptide repeat protein n=1 Tax=Paenarthrobacter sp. AB444 TaxID=3025681 RepID=UPI0023662542|nr:tetratricopeptide repeat protein [Paenarthrobacter sp. AB444]MDD7835175.1 NB-ARC domain-containing protein [Paenarthrobacter sp. AB444]
MSFSATRLTCYALLSSLEQDMRALVSEATASPEIPIELPQDKRAKVDERRKRDGQAPAANIQAVLPYLDFAEVYELAMSLKRKLSPTQLTAIAPLSSRMERVVSIRNRVAHTRPMEIDDSATLIDAAKELANFPGIWAETDVTLSRLSEDPSYVLGLTMQLPKDGDKGPQHNLPVPDFDETGFFGRQEQLRQIKKAIKGPYPVISILGDGGIGKTSLALKAAYDLLDDPSISFDAIVWVTAKSTILSSNEIQRIQGAIEDSLGLFDQAASILSGSENTDSEDEILSYLENFKVLLILDNLETVLDDRLRNFLLELPLGSKVVITSRIGVGSTEYPVSLTPLGTDDASRLLRALARVRGIQQLRELPQEIVERWVNAMSGHPAYIRWFVAGVQTGKRPEDLLTNNALLLDFCMSNVYEYLGDNPRAVLRSMQVLPGARNQAELAYLNDFTADDIQSALLELLTTNFVSMSNLNSNQSVDTGYQLTDFAKQYLDKHHPVIPEERKWLLERKDSLSLMGTGLVALIRATPYDASTVSVRGPGDFHVARLLREALWLPTERERALELCFEAQKLAPTFSEAWRIEGYIHSMDRNDHAAQMAYERAIELAPESASSYFHYGSFLLSDMGDAPAGLRALQTAARFDPQSIEILKGIAWAHYSMESFSEAAETAGVIVEDRSVSAPEKVRALQLFVRSRNAEALRCLKVDDIDAAVEAIELAVEFLASVADERTVASAADHVLHLQQTASDISRRSKGYASSKSEHFAATLRALSELAAGDDARTIGAVKSMKSEKGYMFLRSQGKDYFCHAKDFSNQDDWQRVQIGSICGFTVSSNGSKGLRAMNVSLIDI